MKNQVSIKNRFRRKIWEFLTSKTLTTRAFRKKRNWKTEWKLKYFSVEEMI